MRFCPRGFTSNNRPFQPTLRSPGPDPEALKKKAPTQDFKAFGREARLSAKIRSTPVASNRLSISSQSCLQ